jgi:hypothetical protein
MLQTMALPGFDLPPSPAVQAIDDALKAQFPTKARDFVLTFLRRHQDAGISGEDLTDAMVLAGITPPGGDGRKFGPVFQAMSQKGLIEVYGVGYRRKGNGTLGAAIWRITAKGLKA